MLSTRVRWVYLPIGFAMNVALGTIYSWSVFRIPLERLLQWSTFESGLPFTVFLAVFGLTMPLGGKMMSTLGPKRTALVGATMVGTGWILAGFVGQTPHPLGFMLVFYGLLAGLGVGLVYGVPIAVASRWIPERKGLATGVTILGFGLSPLITALAATSLIQNFGVLLTFQYLGIIFMVSLVLFSLPLRFPPSGSSLASQGCAKGATVYNEVTTRQMLRTKTFLGLWLSFVFGTTGGFIAISLAAKYGSEIIGLTPALAAIATAVFAIFNGAGRPVFGYLCDRMSPRITALLGFSIIFAAAVTAVWATSLTLYMISFALLWFTFGGWLAIAPSATSTFFGLRNVGSNYGMVFTGYGMGAVVGPVVASYIYATAQSYTLAFMSTAVLALVGGTVTFLTFKSPRTPI